MCLYLAYSGGDLRLLLKYVLRQKWSIPMSYITQSHQTPRWVTISPAYGKYGKSSQQLNFLRRNQEIKEIEQFQFLEDKNLELSAFSKS